MTNWTRGVWAVAGVLLSYCAGAAEPVGQLMFVRGAVTIVDQNGRDRIAARGEALHPGERIVTAADGIGQLKLRGGTLVGIRGDSELVLEPLSETGLPQRGMIRLERGAVRVINREPGAATAPTELVLQTPTAAIRLENADSEAFVVPARREGMRQGTYSRLIAGGGTINTGSGNLGLERGRVAYAPSAGEPPATLAALPEKLLISTLAATGSDR